MSLNAFKAENMTDAYTYEAYITSSRNILRVMEQLAAADVLMEMSIHKLLQASKMKTTSRIKASAVLIMKFIMDGQVYRESQIRNKFGNNPDISKALRCLWKSGCVVKTGHGGRFSPFMYRYVRL